MSLAVHVEADGVRIPIARARIAELARRALRAERVRDAMLSITFLSDRAMARLNARHLGHRGATDVISFAFERAGDAGPVVGDIYIAPGVARANAQAAGAGVRAELSRLVIHGVLHVLGWEHPEDGARESSPMWRRQEQLLRRLTSAA